MNTYLADEVDIITISYNADGVATKTIQAGIKARVEDTNQIIKGRDGKELISNMHLVIDSKAAITYEDRIKIAKITGAATLISQKECEIKKLARAHGMSVSHWEVWL